MQNSIKKNRILACSINFFPQRNTDLLLPKHSSTLQGKPSLSALLEKAGSEHFGAQQKHAHTRAGGGSSAGHYFTAPIALSYRTWRFQIKGKTCFETDSPTHCLILVFWYCRYRNSFHLLTALCGRCFITSPYQSPFRKTPTLNFHSNKLKSPWRVIVLLCIFLSKT